MIVASRKGDTSRDRSSDEWPAHLRAIGIGGDGQAAREKAITSVRGNRYKRTVQSGGASVMIWDMCSWCDMGPLIRLETSLTGDIYLSILSNHLHSFMSIVHSDGLGQFQQDNATPHASRVATKWFQEHSSDFRHFHWSPKSSDM
ncbi:hypothetical protein AVEN_53398-1 [Araneus ventricosus]|uniref:Tc1-like transposase DDE domain-containing protein n=1 Tax=Araneus ventricosus TaxID=182803 RepID=A0A4Y2AAJ3_ARAVE|nr:hypothetical protein AVEN_53398-1 [Araneus ventricosus]